MVRQDISRPSDRPTLAAGATLDRVLELLERRKLSATELRVLLALRDRGACLSDLAEALDQRPAEITRAGRSLSMRGLICWHHVGGRKQTRLEITSSGLTTVRALLTVAGATSAGADRPEVAAGASESIRSRMHSAPWGVGAARLGIEPHGRGRAQRGASSA